MKGSDFFLPLSDTEVWLLLPVCASVLMAIVGYFLLNSAVEESSKVTDEEKAALKQQLTEMGAEVTRKAKEKAQKDQQTIAERIERGKLAGDSAPADASSPSTDSSDSTAPPSTESSALRRRRPAKAKASSAASDSSDNDWELVDSDGGSAAVADEGNVEELPAEYQAATDTFIEALHQEGNSVTSLHSAVLAFSSAVQSLLDDSVAKLLPSDPSSSSSSPSLPSSSDVVVCRSLLLSQLVDSETLTHLQHLMETHPSTDFVADAASLLAALTPYLYS